MVALLVPALAASLLSSPQPAQPAQTVALTVHPDQQQARISPLIYGQFLEHIYNSVVDGLWGEQVRNPSFEDTGGGAWSVRDGELSQESRLADVHLEFGDPTSSDYEFTLEARKASGTEGFLILFRALDSKNFYWWNLGGWGNREHGLESEIEDQRRGVAKRVPGSIEAERWYKIRMRVEGDHIEGWLDGEKLLDARDSSHPLGAVGVGTWRTRALFRNLRVTSLDGKMLWEGPPKLEGQGGTALYWDAHVASGDLECALDPVNPLNSRVSQRLDIGLREGWAHGGLRQGRFLVERGREYRGSLWIRAEGFEGVGVVGLVGPDGTALATESLPDPGKEWTEATFTLRPTATHADAALVIAFAASGRVWVDQVSLMSKAAGRAAGFRPDLLQAIRDLRPPMIRWPGGCFASTYRWKDGIGARHERVSSPNVPWGGMDHAQLGTDEFIALCRRVGAESLIVINSGSWDDIKKPEYLQDTLDWIEYCNGPPDSKWGAVRARNGHRQPYNVRYWEIDNETWRMGVETYAEVVKRFSAAMREKDPDIILFACGSGGRDPTWNRRLVELCGDCFEYISWHHYERAEGYAAGHRALEQAWAEMAEFIRNSQHPNLKIAFTEWNLQTTDWRTGLFAGGFLIAAERQAPTMEMASPALFLRNVDAPAWDNAFINFDHTRWLPAPNYVVMRMFRRCFAPVRVKLDGEIPEPLDALATRSEDGERLYVKLLNPTDHEVEFALRIAGGWEPKEAELRWVAAESLTARNTLDEPDVIRERRRAIRPGSEMAASLPGRSVAVLCVAR